MKRLLLTSTVLSILSSPAFAGAPMTCLTSTLTLTGTSWQSAALTVTNKCGAAVDMQNTTLTFNTSSPLNTTVWGEFGPLSYPDNTLQVTSAMGSSGIYLNTIELLFPTGSWATTALPNGSSFTLNFGAATVGYVANSVQVFPGGTTVQPAPSPSPSVTSKPSPSPSPTATVTPKPSPTATPKPSPTATATPKPSPSPSPLPSPSPSPSPSPVSSSGPSGSLLSTASFCTNTNAAVKAPAYTPAASPLDGMGKLFVGYFSTWFDPGVHPGSDATTQLANVAPYVNVVNLAFMQPDATYVKGSLSLTSTGVTYASGGPVLKAAIADLRAKGTKVLISVGGATYPNFAALNVQAIKDFVSDFGLDGVDIDFEFDPTCTWSFSGQTCTSDTLFQTTIESLRAALPRPMILSAAVWSIGAYGQGSFVCDTPLANRTGMLINPLLKDGQMLDLLNVMSYDAGVWSLGTPQASDQTTGLYYPFRAVEAYHQLFPGHIVGGIEMPPEAWGGNITTLAQITQYGSFMTSNNYSGLMFWSLQGSGNSGTPPYSVQQAATQICTALGLSSCSTLILGGH